MTLDSDGAVAPFSGGQAALVADQAEHSRVPRADLSEETTATGMTADGRKHLLLVMLDVDPSVDEDEFNRWYFEEHVAERLACPGFLSARRFKIVEGAPRYLAIYELEGPEAVQTGQYLELAHSPQIGNNVDNPVGSKRTLDMLGSFRVVVRNIYREVLPEDWGVDIEAATQSAASIGATDADEIRR
jgi:hypothetical protein